MEEQNYQKQMRAYIELVKKMSFEAPLQQTLTDLKNAVIHVQKSQVQEFDTRRSNAPLSKTTGLTETKGSVKTPTKKTVNKTSSPKRTKKNRTDAKSATNTKDHAKKVTPMKKNKSRDIVTLGGPTAAAGSASNKKIAS